MEQNVEYKQQLIQEYKELITPFLRYLPWLEQNAGKSVSSSYEGSSITEHSIAFPVYDGTLLNFVREASKSPLMDANYRYVYTRNHIMDHEDERRLIAKAGIREWDVLRGIFSNYVLGGRVKGTMWNEAMKEQIFYLLVKQMKSIVEYWDKPIA